MATVKAKLPKIDKDILAQCLVHILGDKAKGGVKHYRKRLRNPAYLKRVMRSPVGAVYRTFKPIRYF